MRYIIADIHGCFAEYTELLEKIGFSEEDELYVLGDAMDRGPEPLAVLRDMMNRPNVFYILGNHDAMALNVLRKLAVEVTDSSILDLSDEDFLKYYDWIRNGGEPTARQFQALSRPEQEDLLEYLEEASPYETLEQDGKLFILVHAGLNHFAPAKELEEYAVDDFIWGQPDYQKQYFPGGRVVLVTGHTPTPNIRPDRQPLVYEEKGHLALDCGCVFGGRLAADCLETGEVTYVNSRKKKNPPKL